MITQIFLVSLKVPRQQPIISTNDVDVAMPPGVGFFNEAGRPSHFSQLHRNPLQPKAWHSKCSSKKNASEKETKDLYIYNFTLNSPQTIMPNQRSQRKITKRSLTFRIDMVKRAASMPGFFKMHTQGCATRQPRVVPLGGKKSRQTHTMPPVMPMPCLDIAVLRKVSAL